MPKGKYIRTETTRENMSKARKGKHYLKLSESMEGNKNALKKRLSKGVADIIEKMKEEQAEEQKEYIKTVIRRIFTGEK